MKLHTLFTVFLLMLSITLNGCGGGSSSGKTVQTGNQNPVANASTDRTVQLDHTITITGSGSDSDGNIVAYQWKRGNVILADTASFTYEGTALGTETLTLTVTDNLGASSSDTMDVSTTVDAPNEPPLANAGTDREVQLDHSITITGSGSDNDGSIVTYQWKRGNVILADTTSFSYTGSTLGTETLILTVTDNNGATNSDTMDVSTTVDAPPNLPPLANAGVDRAVQLGQTITITGSGSDSDGNIMVYQWKRGNVILADTASFSYTGRTLGTETLTLTVTDNIGTTSNDTMNVTTLVTKLISVSNDYQVESLGSASTIQATISIDTSTAKDLYLVLSNHATSSAGSTITHNAKVTNTAQSKSIPLNNFSEIPNILRSPQYIQDFSSTIDTLLSTTARDQPQTKSISPSERSEDSVNQSQTFYLDANGYQNTYATARKITSNVTTNLGTKTLNVWVSNDSFDSGSGCSKAKCVTQHMVDQLANTFLKSGTDNDIYDWITNIYGEEWANDTNGHSGLISPNDAITILLTDIDNDNSTTGGVVGFFWSKDNFQSGVRGSNKRIMFYIDAVMFASGQGTWDINDFWPKEMISTLAHEFQHMINFYQKRILLDTDTDTWINEMLSETTEDIVATKIQHIGPRGVAYTDGNAGPTNNTQGRYPLFNRYNTLSLTAWSSQSADYSKVNAFGAYLIRNYGGAKLLHDIMHNRYSGKQAIVNAVQKSPDGSGKTFNDLLTEWGTAVTLSDHENLVDLPFYNSGDFTYSSYKGITYDMGSVNFFNYNPLPTIHTTAGTIQAEGNYYYKVGENLTGTVTINLQLNGQTEATLIAK